MEAIAISPNAFLKKRGDNESIKEEKIKMSLDFDILKECSEQG